MLDPKLAGKVAIVTGINNPCGIGATTMRALAGQDVAVLGTYLDEIGLDQVGALMDAGSTRWSAFRADLADPASVAAIFSAAEEAFGPVSILVANAAYSEPDTFLPVAPQHEDWAGRSQPTITARNYDAHVAVNSRGTAMLIAEFARRALPGAAGWGRIITLSTGSADGFPGEVSYGATKAAIESLSRAAALELAPHGITVNIVSPGPIQTGWIPPEHESEIAALCPLGRVGTPEDVADVILFLASDQARWLTGQTLQVGGGHKM